MLLQNAMQSNMSICNRCVSGASSAMLLTVRRLLSTRSECDSGSTQQTPACQTKHC